MKKSIISLLCAMICCVELCGCVSSENSKHSVHIPVSSSQSKIEYTLFEVQQGDLVHIDSVECTYKPAKKESLSFFAWYIKISFWFGFFRILDY